MKRQMNFRLGEAACRDLSDLISRWDTTGAGAIERALEIANSPQEAEQPKPHDPPEESPLKRPKRDASERLPPGTPTGRGFITLPVVDEEKLYAFQKLTGMSSGGGRRTE